MSNMSNTITTSLSPKSNYIKISKTLIIKSYNAIWREYAVRDGIRHHSQIHHKDESNKSKTGIRFNPESTIRLFADDAVQDIDWMIGEHIGKTNCIIEDWSTPEKTNEAVYLSAEKIRKDCENIKMWRNKINQYQEEQRRPVFFNSKKNNNTNLLVHHLSLSS
jgi:hypothetical protein